MVFQCLHNCSECCALQIFEVDIFERNKERAVYTEAKLGKNDEGEILYITYTEDGMCPFLDHKTNKCRIYDDRPKVCRDYGLVPELLCPYVKPNGSLRTPAGIKHTQRIINREVDEKMKRIKEKYGQQTQTSQERTQ